MEEVFGAKYASLHVRVTNKGAFHLYSETLGYKVHDTEEKYYADGEDAFDMRKYFVEQAAGEKWYYIFYIYIYDFLFNLV